IVTGVQTCALPISLYLKALLRGLFDGPPADPELRRRLTLEGEGDGFQALHQRLAEVDPVSASRLHPHDVRRVVRALEVWEITGRPISAWQKQWTSHDEPMTEKGDLRLGRCLWLDVPRNELYARINDRVRRMITEGWLE